MIKKDKSMANIPKAEYLDKKPTFGRQESGIINVIVVIASRYFDFVDRAVFCKKLIAASMQQC